MSPRRSLVWLTALLLAMVPISVAAHARWFVDGELPPTDWSAVVSWPVLIATVLAAATVVALARAQRFLDDPLWPRPPMFQRLEPAAPAILAVQTAIAMIYAATQLHLFVPNIDLPRNIAGIALAGIAIIAGFSFITGVLTRIGALMTIGLLVVAFFFARPEEVAEQVIFAGIALYLVAVGRGVVRFDGEEEDRTALSDHLLPHALMILRVSAGASILILAFTEKLINVELGVAFLEAYPRFNVLRELGFDWFTNERFVYTAGIVEAIAGVALLAGYLPRVVILGLWIPFNLGIAFLPPQELIGHLPILSTMYVLLVRGTEGIPPVPVDRQTEPAQRPAVRLPSSNGATRPDHAHPTTIVER